MFDNLGVIVAFILILIVGLGYPISLFMAAKRGEKNHEVSRYKKAFKGIKNPWKAEDDQLSELSKRVKELKEK